MPVLVSSVFAEHQNVIKEYIDKLSKELLKGSIHGCLKSGWGIWETKWHDKKLKVYRMSSESCFMNITVSYSSLALRAL